MSDELLSMRELDALTQFSPSELNSFINRFSTLTRALDRSMHKSEDSAFRSQMRNQRTRVQALLDVATAWRDVSEVA